MSLCKFGGLLLNSSIHQYGKRLYGLCLTLCANTLEADDLYQNTWLQVVKNFSRYDASQDFEPWLTKICVDLYRNEPHPVKRTMK